MRFRILVVLILSIFLCSCSSSSNKRRMHGGGGVNIPVQQPLESPAEVDRSPWELWSFGQDMQGVSITVPEIREGDAAIKSGDYEKGIRLYISIDPGLLNEDQLEALTVRTASAYLSIGQYLRSLDTISNYFKGRGQSADAVSGHFALLLAYGYGATFDYDQSLAWFSRADAAPSNSPAFTNVATTGARLLVASMPQDVFQRAVTKWTQDGFISRFFQQELTLRQDPAYQPAPKTATFWLRPMPNEVSFGQPPLGHKLDSVTVGVLLPTSGSLGVLGVNTKNGIELAAAVENEPRINFLYKDTMGDPGAAVTASQELIQKDKALVILGPLLAEPATAVRQVVSDLRVNQVALSKSNSFQVGGSIFRFGATTNGQVDSLLEKCSTILGMTKFALVYPQSPVGLEFAAAFKKYTGIQGLELVYEATYLPDDTTLFQQMSGEIERSGAQGIFLPDSLQRAQQFFALLSPEFREKIRPLGPALWDDATQLANSQLIFDRAVFVSPFFQSTEHPVVNKFVEVYFQKFGKKPDFLAAQGFDAATMVIGAARKMMDEGAPFDLAFKDIEAYEGVTGVMRVDVSGEVFRSYRIVESRDGELREIKQQQGTQ